MDAEFFERDAVINVFSAPVCSGSIHRKLKLTPPFSSLNSSAAPVLCPSFPPSLKTNVHVNHHTLVTALFQSLLFEAAGRTVNPVNGAVGLLWTGNWHVCQASVDTVLRGGTLRPIPELLHGHSILPKLGKINKLNDLVSPSNTVQTTDLDLNQNLLDLPEIRRQGSPSINSDDSFVTTMCLDCDLREIDYGQEGREAHLLNLFK
ncbi:hypothetical protein R6Q57_026386 [Mikania cordata]